MPRPTILVTDGDRRRSAALRRDIGTRYADEYAVVHSNDAAAGRAACIELAGRGAAVALLVAAERLPDQAGTIFLRDAHSLHPNAGRLLLVGHANAEAAVIAVNDIGFDRCLVAPWTDPDTDLYPVLDEQLADWSSRARIRPALVGELMQREVTTLDAGASVAQAARLLATSRASELMVADAHGRFVGVVSEADILTRSLPDFDDLIAGGGTLSDGDHAFLRRARELSDQPAARLVITDPFVVGPDDHVAKAAALLMAHEIRVLPVVEDGRLVGTLSRADICQTVFGAA